MKSKLSLLGVLALAFAWALAGCGTPDTAPLPGEEPPGLEEPLTPGAEETHRPKALLPRRRPRRQRAPRLRKALRPRRALRPPRGR